MADTLEQLIVDLMDWLETRERSYEETLDAWRTSCPRFPVWEDANDRGFVETASENGRAIVRVTPKGRSLRMERLQHRAASRT
jgi:D-3-phosphoglycerate dehydrogenase